MLYKWCLVWLLRRLFEGKQCVFRVSCFVFCVCVSKWTMRHEEKNRLSRAYLSAVEAGAKTSKAIMQVGPAYFNKDNDTGVESLSDTSLRDPYTNRLRWNRVYSTVSLSNVREPFHSDTVYKKTFRSDTGLEEGPTQASRECAAYLAKNSTWETQPYAKEDKWEEPPVSQSQLANPGVVYPKSRLPVRTQSSVQIGGTVWGSGVQRNRLDLYHSGKEPLWEPEEPVPRFSWTRTKSSVKLNNPHCGVGPGLQTTPASVEHYQDPKVSDGRSPRRGDFTGIWNQSCSDLKDVMGIEVDDHPRGLQFSKRPHKAIFPSPINAQAREVDLPKEVDSLTGITHDNWATTTNSSYPEMQIPESSLKQKPHVRTQSTWRPGRRVTRLDDNKTSDIIGRDVAGCGVPQKRFQWNRQHSGIRINKMGAVSMREARTPVAPKVGTLAKSTLSLSTLSSSSPRR